MSLYQSVAKTLAAHEGGDKPADAVDNDDTASSQMKFTNKTLQDYEVLSVIGNGAFGTCYKVRDKESGALFAWKGMDYDELSESQKASLVSEISVLRQLQHPNIVQYYHHLVNHEAKSIYIVMECCEGGDLAQLIERARRSRRRFEEKYIWRVLFQLCKALQVCHNKFQQGTILHRDIKPANIFLDAAGNVKLGDFGLARLLRRDEAFAATFVGTPYYMSPEIVKGSKYDRKSDVWAVGCLIYELCALRTPFVACEFEQLSANISNGKYSSIPAVYSGDLQEIISFMLEVDNDQRPGIEVVTRHPVVVRNINDLGNEFPQLLDAEEDFYIPSAPAGTTACKLDFSPVRRELSSTMYTEQCSFNEDYGQRRLSISGVFTPELRTELFYSAKRRIFADGKRLRKPFQQSDPALYESIRREEYATIDGNENVNALAAYERETGTESKLSPELLTKHVFDNALQARLHAIRAQESLLKQRERELDAREEQLNGQEKRLQALERSLNEQRLELVASKANARIVATTTLERRRLPLPNEVAPVVMAPPAPPPPIPPRKSSNHDDTYCTIEPNDSMLQQPTVAKMNLATLPAAKSFPTLRKMVTFQSPQKFVKYDIENVVTTAGGGKLHATTSTGPQSMQTSVSSKASDESGDSHASGQRRKSILSIFGLSRSKDNTSSAAAKATAASSILKQQRQPLAAKAQEQPQAVLCKPKSEIELNNMWTKEQKRAAFDLLAAMNAAAVQDANGAQRAATVRHKLRQSVRERNTLHRNRMRRSLIVGATQPAMISAHVGAGREQILI